MKPVGEPDAGNPHVRFEQALPQINGGDRLRTGSAACEGWDGAADPTALVCVITIGSEMRSRRLDGQDGASVVRCNRRDEPNGGS